MVTATTVSAALNCERMRQRPSPRRSKWTRSVWLSLCPVMWPSTGLFVIGSASVPAGGVVDPYLEQHAEQFAGNATDGGDADRCFIGLVHGPHVLARRRESAGRIRPGHSQALGASAWRRS